MAIAPQTPAKLGVRARERNALERISDLEARVENFLSATQESFNNNDKNVGELVEVVTALVRILGAEQVADTMKEIQKEKADAEVARGKALLQSKIEAGELVAGTVVTPESVITGVERNVDGTEVAPGYIQTTFGALKPEYQTKLLAISVGTKIDTEEGRTFELTGVYEPVAPTQLLGGPGEAAQG